MAETACLDDELANYPEFDLSYAFDQRHYPTELTIYEHGDHIAARWLTGRSKSFCQSRNADDAHPN